MGNSKNTAVNKAANNKPQGEGKTPVRLDGTRIFLIVFASLALLGIIAALVVGIVSYANSRMVDYDKDNLGKYIKIDKSLYSSYDVLINLDRISLDENNAEAYAYTQMMVEQEIIKLQYKYREATNGKNDVDQTIKVGDVANIFYYGYTLDADGNKVPFTGGSNFGSSISELGIGSGQMIPGFELALIGKNSANYSKLTKKTSGVVEDGNLVYITYTVTTYDGGAEKDATMVVDLSEDVDAKYGKGFKEFLLGATVGKKIVKNDQSFVVVDKVVNGVTRSDTYEDVTVNSIVEFSEGEPLTIDVTFPKSYNAKELAGKAVKFDIYIMTSVNYNTPAFDDTFVTEKLKLTADDLADYEGESLAEKYRAKVAADLYDKYEAEENAVIEDTFWNHVIDNMKVKKLPKAEVESFYRSGYNDVVAYYSNYQSYYKSFDEAARAYLGLATGESWEDALRANAERAVKEKLAFYYIARAEDLKPEGEAFEATYDRIYNDILDSYLTQYEVSRENFDTDEEYEEKVQYYRDMIDTQYGEAYFNEAAYFEYVMDIIRSNAKITYAE